MIGKPLEDIKVNVRIKLALLWTSLMSLYIYADYFELMTPGKLERMMQLQTPMGPASPGLLISFAVLLIIPALMIGLSVFLPPQLCKWMNLIFGVIYAIISVLIIKADFGSEWHNFIVLYNVIELFVLAAIIWQALRWPSRPVEGR